MVLESPNGEKISYTVRLKFNATNNQDKYEVLISWLKLAQAVQANKVKIRTDLQLIADHINERF